MSAGWNVYVDDPAQPKAREWVTQAGSSNEASDVCKYLAPKLPGDLKPVAQWDRRPEDCKQFDLSKLVEKPNEWKEEG